VTVSYADLDSAMAALTHYANSNDYRGITFTHECECVEMDTWFCIQPLLTQEQLRYDDREDIFQHPRQKCPKMIRFNQPRSWRIYIPLFLWREDELSHMQDVCTIQFWHFTRLRKVSQLIFGPHGYDCKCVTNHCALSASFPDMINTPVIYWSLLPIL